MLQSSYETTQRFILNLLIPVYPHSRLKLRAEALYWKNQGNLADLADEYGLSHDLLIRQQAGGYDNPAYRFARDGGFYSWLNRNRHQFKDMSWLDVGADTGCVSAYMEEYLESTKHELIDVRVNPDHNFTVHAFPGESLPYPDNSFDIVLFSFVLHHAAASQTQLLLDAKRVARHHVFVLEDPRETANDVRWAREHDKNGIFRSLSEWRELFQKVGLEIQHEEALGDMIHSRHFFHLTPPGVAT